MTAITEIINDVKAARSGKAKRIIIAGGGTGGHIFPAIAIANALKKIDPDTDILFIGAIGKMEMEKIPEAGYPIKGLPIAGYNRSSILKNITLPVKLIQSFLAVRSIFSNYKPDAVIGVGGYSSFPVLRFAQTKNIPTFIHEANSYAGKSNLLLAKRAAKIFVANDGMAQFFPYKNVIVTGNPIRSIFHEFNIIRKEAVEFFGLDATLQTVFIMGGSLGARSINECIEMNLPFFKSKQIQLIWQTGKNYARAAALQEEQNSGIYTNAFISKIEYAYAAADIIVSRAGAMAIAELCVIGKPVIFVPYPFAAEDHQVANAMTLVNKGAALMVKDSEVNDKLISAINTLIDDKDKSLAMKENISLLANKNADELIANEILNYLN